MGARRNAHDEDSLSLRKERIGGLDDTQKKDVQMRRALLDKLQMPFVTDLAADKTWKVTGWPKEEPTIPVIAALQTAFFIGKVLHGEALWE